MGSIIKPDNQLDPELLILNKNGNGFYQTHGKYSGEEFYTYETPFEVIFEDIL